MNYDETKIAEEWQLTPEGLLCIAIIERTYFQ